MYLQSNLAFGTLMWINASNKKVYHSSKRCDAVSFNKHESNYLGKIEKVFSNNDEQIALLSGLLENTDRIYGICMNNKIPHSNKPENIDMLFFPTWAEMLNTAKIYFKKYDEKQRKNEAKQEWLERGRLYVKKNH
ncbi:hypothetical protein GCM10027286_29740 [Virgibacillus ainsalahensis]